MDAAAIVLVLLLERSLSISNWAIALSRIADKPENGGEGRTRTNCRGLRCLLLRLPLNFLATHSLRGTF